MRYKKIFSTKLMKNLERGFFVGLVERSFLYTPLCVVRVLLKIGGQYCIFFVVLRGKVLVMNIFLKFCVEMFGS